MMCTTRNALRKTAKHMEGYGQRMQYSVFRCWLTPKQLECLRWELTEILKPEDDVLFIPLCSTCVDGIVATHSTSKEPDWPEAPPRPCDRMKRPIQAPTDDCSAAVIFARTFAHERRLWLFDNLDDT